MNVQVEEGGVYEIRCDPNRFYYCVVAKGGDVAFFDIVRNEPAQNAIVVSDCDVIMRLAINWPSIRRAKWKKIGTVSLRGSLSSFGQYIQGRISNGRAKLYDNEKSTVRLVEASEVAGLEYLAVWDARSHIPSLLGEHFFGEKSPFSNEIRSLNFKRAAM